MRKRCHCSTYWLARRQKIENEYEAQRQKFGAAGDAYVKCIVHMAVSMNTGVPWAVCKESDASDPVINTCNGLYCDYFSVNKPYKPPMWTEALTSRFTEFGGPICQCPVEFAAFAVAQFIQRGVSLVNYYMGFVFERMKKKMLKSLFDFWLPRELWIKG